MSSELKQYVIKQIIDGRFTEAWKINCAGGMREAMHDFYWSVTRDNLTRSQVAEHYGKATYVISHDETDQEPGVLQLASMPLQRCLDTTGICYNVVRVQELNGGRPSLGHSPFRTMNGLRTAGHTSEPHLEVEETFVFDEQLKPPRGKFHQYADGLVLFLPTGMSMPWVIYAPGDWTPLQWDARPSERSTGKSIGSVYAGGKFVGPAYATADGKFRVEHGT